MSLKALILIATALTAAPALAADVKVDESALRYYAAHNETERVQAEIRRLQSLYPDWVVPADLTAASDDRESQLWAIFKTGDMSALQAAIATMKASDPHFEPSADLADKMDRKLARDQLIAASDAADSAKVLEIAAAHPDFGGCADLDVGWRVAAAHAARSEAAVAQGLYTDLLKACTDGPARLATVQKAIASLGPAGGHALLAYEKTPGEFDVLRPDFARAAIGQQLASGSGPDPDPADLAALEKVAENGPKTDDAQMLGWWYRSRHVFDKALAHFQMAATLAGAGMDPKIAEGLVLSFDDLGRRPDAIIVAHDNRTRSDTLAKLYVDLGTAMFEGHPRPDIAAGTLADYADSVGKLSSASGAEVLGWYYLDKKDARAASDWFGRGLGWSPSETLASGAIYAASARNDAKEVRALMDRWSADYPNLARLKLGGPQPGKASKDPIIAAFERKDFSNCVVLAGARNRLAPDLSLIEGWCLMQLRRPSEAALAFDKAMSGSGKTRQDAAYGKSLAAMASGDVRGAVATATTGITEPSRRAEIGAAALARQAQERFDAEDWRGALLALNQRAAAAPETSDLALLRGWCLWHLGESREARQLFVRLDTLLSTRETRRALAATGGPAR